MSKYIPYPFFYDDMPIDISKVFENEKPAGKHGFLKTEGRNFVFEDGTKVKFWGTNFNGAACFPDHSYAEKVAKRLAKTGINMVRLHQLDAEFHTPNIFSFTKGAKRARNGSLDSESVDRLDYLIYCLKKEGIYIYMDMLTYRKFYADEMHIESNVEMRAACKPSCCFSDRLIELQKEFCDKFWSHENPYTKLKNCDDPVFAMAEIVNESGLFATYQNQFPAHMTPWHTEEFLNKFDKWLKECKSDKKASDFDLYDYEDETILSFKIYLQEKYFGEMKEHLKKCGVKIPVTGTNWTQTPANIKTQGEMDYLDSHSYYYDWGWKEFEKKCMNKAVTQSEYSFFDKCAFATAKDKPTIISEWDVPWPNEYRAEGSLYAAAYGMLQGWSGFTIHTYSYSTRLERMNILGKEIMAEKIGGVPFRQGVFSTWNDPAKFGLFYHAALITRRGDVLPSKNLCEIYPLSLNKWDIAGTRNLFEKGAVVTSFDKFGDETQQNIPDEILSDTGQLYINRKKNYGYIDAPMTKCVYGFLSRNGEIEITGLKVKAETDFGVIAISSLTDSEISSSENILLTAVGRAQNTEAKFEGELMLDIGKPPVTVEVIKAEIEFETNVRGLFVHAISPEGYYIGTIPAVYEEGKYKFSVGEDTHSMYYLIVKE